MSHLDPGAFEVVPVGITESGTWTLGPSDFSGLEIVDRVMPTVPATGTKVALGLDSEDRGVLRFVEGERAGGVAARVDVVMPVLHGTFGEDGTVQGLLDLSGVPYVGPGVFSSAAGMDKEFTKIVLGAAGLPIGRQEVLRAGDTKLADEVLDALGLPLFVKPARGGSSIGISKVGTREALADAVEVARKYDDKVIVEEFIRGREIECGVLEYPDGRIEASLPAEIHMPGHGSSSDDGSGGAGGDGSDDPFYDFDSKYLDDVVSFDVPALLTDRELEEIRALSIETFRALDAKGLSRIDFFLTPGGPVINEVNTMPGFTPISMYPQMWQASGVTYPELLDTLVRTALSRG